MRPIRPAFSLVELLVVVTIVVVLLAMLTPAMDQAMAAAERTTCAAKLHGLANAGAQYRMDHKRAFPTIVLQDESPIFGDGNVYSSYHYWGGKAGSLLGDQALTVPRLINPYVGEMSTAAEVFLTGGSAALNIFLCPSDRGHTGGWAGANGFSHLPRSFDAWGTSYFYNSSGNRNNNTGLYRKRNTSNSPSTVVVSADWSSYAWFIYEQTGAAFHTTNWHVADEAELGWGNVQFVDGHVAYTQAVLVDRPEGTSWNPDVKIDHVYGPDYTFAANQQP